MTTGDPGTLFNRFPNLGQEPNLETKRSLGRLKSILIGVFPNNIDNECLVQMENIFGGSTVRELVTNTEIRGEASMTNTRYIDLRN